MIHLSVAKEINDKINIAKDLPQFFLGSLAPDSVHFRENYQSAMKMKSHYHPGKKPWGVNENEDVDEWLNYVLTEISPGGNHFYDDFYMGFIIHILTDIYNTRNQAIPYIKWLLTQKNKKNIQIEGRRLYYTQCIENNLALYKTLPWKNEIWALLKKSKGKSIYNIIEAQEVEKFKEFVFDDLRNGDDTLVNFPTYCSLDKNLCFISSAADEIIGLLKISVI